MPDFPRSEVEEHFSRWRRAVDRRDLAAMTSMLAPDARGGNAVFGVAQGRDAILEFMKRWPERVPNRSLWVAIDGARVVDKWRETLPGEPPVGRDYHYDGISELGYAGGGQWDFMYGLPDVVGLQRAYARWREDGHEAVYGEIYPGL